MDILQREGRYPPPPGSSDILGVEFSGQVVKIGDKTSLWNVGDEVLGLAGGVRYESPKIVIIVSHSQGAYAEYIAVRETHLMTKPSHLSWIDAASIPEAFLTGMQHNQSITPLHFDRNHPAYQAMIMYGEIKTGEHALVHAAASGVGIAAIQLARVRGASVQVPSFKPSKLNH